MVGEGENQSRESLLGKYLTTKRSRKEEMIGLNIFTQKRSDRGIYSNDSSPHALMWTMTEGAFVAYQDQCRYVMVYNLFISV